MTYYQAKPTIKHGSHVREHGCTEFSPTPLSDDMANAMQRASVIATTTLQSDPSPDFRSTIQEYHKRGEGSFYIYNHVQLHESAFVSASDGDAEASDEFAMDVR